MILQSYALGQWQTPTTNLKPVYNAVTGEVAFEASSDGLNIADMLEFARTKGAPALAKLTFHERATMLKSLALYLQEHKSKLYALSPLSGATKADTWIDVDGGIATMFVYASKGKRELPNQPFDVDGAVERISKNGTFLGQHIYVPRQGVAVHINAFNFPCWGLLEKLAPTLLSGMPMVVKPAVVSSFLAEALGKLIIESGILPQGAFQMVLGSARNLLDDVGSQDIVSFTGSAQTAMLLQRHPNIAEHAVSFVAERDSLNATILGADIEAGTPDFDVFIKEVVKEMTTKCGQKCTAIRRIIVPAKSQEAVLEALSKRLSTTKIGDPSLETTRMGALASLEQRQDVLEKLAILKTEASVVYGNDTPDVDGADAQKGAFISPTLLHCANPLKAQKLHETEAFGPVATLMPYNTLEEALTIANKGGGSLVASLITQSEKIASDVVFGIGANHGRIFINNTESAAEATGHGSPLPHLVHGGPGRAGGGEEMGGIRGVHHMMRRVAVQGSPRLLSAITQTWIKGAPEIIKDEHPFRYAFGELEIGQTYYTPKRTITLEDIEHFANFTGDTFYAHMDAEATTGHPFFPGRVAHGYLLLSFAAGLFVEPSCGPVLANYGLEGLRFEKPVEPGQTIGVRLSVKSKAPRHADYGQVRWDVEIFNQDGETVATYDLLTMNAYHRNWKEHLSS